MMKLIRGLKKLHKSTMNSLRTQYNNKAFHAHSRDFMAKYNAYARKKRNEWKVGDLLHRRDCPICNSGKAKLILDKTEINGCKYDKCCKCGFVFQNPMPPQTYYNDIYKSGFGGLDKWWFRQKEKDGYGDYSFSKSNKMLDRIKERKKDGAFLDYGCGTGWVLAGAKNIYDIYGVDMDIERIKTARKRLGDIEGKRIINFDEVNKESFHEKFDVVHTNQVIEHLLEPMHYLKNFYKWMKPEGLLYLAAPCSDSFAFSFLGKHNSMASFAHVSLFNKKSLRYVLESIGFEKIEIDYFTLDITASEFWKKIFNLKFLHRHAFVENKFLIIILYPIILVTTAILGMLSLFGILKGNYFYVFAKKPLRNL